MGKGTSARGGGLLGMLSNMFADAQGLSPVTVGSLSKAELAAAAALVTVPLWLAVRQWAKKKTRSGQLPYPPGPKGNWVLGNMLQLPSLTSGRIIDDKLLEWAIEYGQMYTLRVPGLGRMIVITDPDLVRKIYVAMNFPKDFTYKWISPIVGSESILSVPVEDWKVKRKAFNPGFAPKFLKNMVVTMAEKLERFVACIEADIDSNEATNMLARTQTFTSDVIVTIAFGEDWGGSVPHPARDWETQLCRLINLLFAEPMRYYFDFWTLRKVRKYEKLLDDEMMAILERRLEAGVNADAKDICSIAVNEMVGENGYSLSEQDKVSITHQLKTFYFAGHETTATTISWAIWLLSQHDNALAKVRSELKEHGIWSDRKVPPTYDDLQKCEYLESVVKETLRLYPPAAVVSRYAPDDTQTYKGYNISGAILMLEIYAMGRHPALWKDPEVFRPERFLDGSEDRLGEKFVAFSRGPRDCIGKYFAILEAKLTISALVTLYDLECVDAQEEIMAQITNVPRNGAQVRFKRRPRPLIGSLVE